MTVTRLPIATLACSLGSRMNTTLSYCRVSACDSVRSSFQAKALSRQLGIALGTDTMFYERREAGGDTAVEAHGCGSRSIAASKVSTSANMASQPPRLKHLNIGQAPARP